MTNVNQKGNMVENNEAVQIETQTETSNLKQELKEIDDRIAELEEFIKLGEAVRELIVDERYMKVFVDGFFDSERDRIAGVLTTPNSFDRGQLDIFLEKLAAIRHTKEYIKVCLINYDTAIQRIEDEKEYRKQVTAKYSQDIDAEEV